MKKPPGDFNGKIVVFNHNNPGLPLFIRKAEERPNFRYIGIAYDQSYDVVAVRWISDNPASVGHFVNIRYLRVVPNWILRNGLCTNHIMDSLKVLEEMER